MCHVAHSISPTDLRAMVDKEQGFNGPYILKTERGDFRVSVDGAIVPLMKG